MSNAASTASLNELHRKLTEQLIATLDRDTSDDLPTDAATLSVISGFLARNNITCDPADKDTTAALQEKFKAQSAEREARKKKALELVKKTGTND